MFFPSLMLNGILSQDESLQWLGLILLCTYYCFTDVI